MVAILMTIQQMLPHEFSVFTHTFLLLISPGSMVKTQYKTFKLPIFSNIWAFPRTCDLHKRESHGCLRMYFLSSVDRWDHVYNRLQQTGPSHQNTRNQLSINTKNQLDYKMLNASQAFTISQ